MDENEMNYRGSRLFAIVVSIAIIAFAGSILAYNIVRLVVSCS